MKCPHCSWGSSAVLEARQTQQYKRRRRECLSCEHRWTTVEVTAEEYKELKELANKAQQLQSILSKGLL